MHRIITSERDRAPLTRREQTRRIAKQFRMLRPRYSLGAILIAVTCCCIWLGRVAADIRTDRGAIALVTELRGLIIYDYEIDESSIPPGGYLRHGRRLPGVKPPGPAWLRGLIGDEYFTEVVLINLSETTVSDQDLASMNRLSHLRCLYLDNTTIGDAGLARLTDLPMLEELYLDNANISDAGLTYLNRLEKLRWLELCRNEITDAGIANLKGRIIHPTGLSNLEGLDLSNNPITDAGLKHLTENLFELRTLDVQSTHVTELGIEKLRSAWPDCQGYK